MPRPPRIHIQREPLMALSNQVAHGLAMPVDDGLFNKELIGLLAETQKRHGMSLHAGAVTRSGWQLLAGPETVEQQASFMRDFTRELCRLLQRYLPQHEGPIFTRRYHAMEISNEVEDQLACLHRLLHNEHEGPIEYLRPDRPASGLRFDQKAFRTALRKGKAVEEHDFFEELEVTFSPLPCLVGLDPDERRRVVATSGPGNPQMHAHGADRRCRIYAGRETVLRALHKGMKSLVCAYREASRALRSTKRRSESLALFPANCFPSALPFVPYP